LKMAFEILALLASGLLRSLVEVVRAITTACGANPAISRARGPVDCAPPPRPPDSDDKIGADYGDYRITYALCWMCRAQLQ